jgi:hypothetical protein
VPVTRTSGQGRPKGALNKRTLDVIDKLAALHCDPITGMALIAMNEKNPAELRGRMFAELARLSQLAPNNPPGGRFPVVGSCKVGTTEAAVIAISEYHPT